MGVPGSGEDFLDDEGDDEEFIDTTAEEEPPVPPSSTSQSAPQSSPAASRTAPRKRMVRIKPLAPSLAAKFPGVVTILVTRSDGSQILFVQQKGG